MPTATETESERAPERASCWVDKNILRQAKALSAMEDLSLSEILERDLRPAISNRFKETVAKATHELSEATHDLGDPVA